MAIRTRWHEGPYGIAAAVAAIAVLVAVPWTFGMSPDAVDPASESAASDALAFGMDIDAIKAQEEAGVAPDYAVVWVGPWIETSGWAGVDRALDRAYAADVTPVVHFYYWGNAISPRCVADGCNGKDKASWDALADELAAHLDPNEPAMVILETEFNKNGVETWEPFDAMLAAKADFFHDRLPHATVVMGLGTWGAGLWDTWDRAAAAADAVGLQAMRASTRDTPQEYLDVVDRTVEAAETAQALFGKPVVVTDVALSSWPDSDWERHQADTLTAFFDQAGALKDAGVDTILYRDLRDDPARQSGDYYGAAETDFGLVDETGQWKPAMSVWVDGVQDARGHDAAAVA